jgi:hypothetical protein
VDKAIVMPIGKQDSMGGPYVVSVEDFQNLKMIEDRASDALLRLDSTLDTIVSGHRQLVVCQMRQRNPTRTHSLT